MITAELIQALLGVGCLFAGAFGLYSLRRREQRGALPLAVLFLGVTLWMLADLIQFVTPTNPMPAGGVELRLLAPDIAVIGLLLFAFEYTGRDRWITPQLVALLAVKPLLTLLVLVTPLRDTQLVPSPEATAQWGYDFALTTFFASHTLYSWLLTLAALGLVGHMLVRGSRAYRYQLLALALAISFPFGANVLFHLGLIEIDPTASGFLVTASLFMLAAFRLRLLDTLPIARQTVLEEMEDAVIALDENDMVMIVNERATALFGDGDLIGKSIESVLGTHPNTQTDGDHDHLTLDIDGETKHFDLGRSTVTDYRGNLLAHVLVFRDVTQTQRRQEQLRQRERELDLLKDLQSRFLRHNLRNELNVVQANAELITDSDEESRQRYDRIAEKTDQLLSWGEKARTIEQLIETDDLVERDLSAIVDRLVTDAAQRYPRATFECDLCADGTATVVPQIDRALSNVIENAVEHNTAEQPVVRVQTRRENGSVVVTISDNGPGLPPQEIDSIKDGYETELQHGSGFGLWLVYWVVNKSGGDLSFDSEDGTTVELRFDSPSD